MRSSSWSIRPGRVHDISRLQAIERAADDLFPTDRLPGPPSIYSEQGYLRAIEYGLLLVAHTPCTSVGSASETAVGFAVAEPDEQNLHLYLLAVHPEFGQQGIGRQLMEETIQFSKNEGFTGLTLTTFRDIAWNAPFYASLGFTELDHANQSELVQAALIAEADAGLTNRLGMQLVL